MAREHEHQWEDVRRFYLPPKFDATGFQGAREAVERAVYGFTSIELRCVMCGDAKNVTLLGDFTEDPR